MDICVLLSFIFVHWLSRDYCTKKRHSECLPFTHIILRQKNITFFKTEIDGLVVCGYDDHFCTFKKNDFIYFFPSSDSAMKTRISLYVLSIIWLWSFCPLTIRQTWVKYNELKSYLHAVVFRSFAAAAGCIWLVAKDKDKNIHDDLDLSFSSGLTRVCYNCVNTPVFLEK